MSMLLPYDTMSMKNPLSVALKIFNVEAQLQAIAQPIMILKKNEHLLCSTCITIWKRWIVFHVSVYCIFYLFSQVPLGLIHLFFYIVNSTNRIGGLIIKLQTSS
jgi:hypothetical protein